MRNFITSFLLCCIGFYAGAQKVAINADGSAPNASAILDIKSTSKGLLPPRMSSAERTAIATPAAGLIVYDTSRKSLFIYNGSQWMILQATDPASPNSYAGQQNTIPAGIVAGSDYSSDELGISVGIYGDYAFIGAQGYTSSRSGYVLVYKRTGDDWQFFQVINPPTPVSYMRFGYKVIAKSNYLFIAATGDQNASAVTSGAVYVYTFNGMNWVMQQKLLPSTALSNGQFGVQIDANTNADELAVFASGNSLVNIFKRTGTVWGVPQAITVTGLAALAMQPDGDAIAFGVIPASEVVNTVSYTHCGHINFYTKSGSNYVLATTVPDPNPKNEDYFGRQLMFGLNYSPLDYILWAGSDNQVQVGSFDITTPASYNFGSGYGKTFDGSNGFGSFPFTTAQPYVSDFNSSGPGEYFMFGTDESLGIYSAASSAAWFSTKGTTIKLPEPVTFINVGTQYSVASWGVPNSSFETQPTYIVIGTPLANNGKGAFYFLKF